MCAHGMGLGRYLKGLQYWRCSTQLAPTIDTLHLHQEQYQEPPSIISTPTFHTHLLTLQPPNQLPTNFPSPPTPPTYSSFPIINASTILPG